GAGAGGEEGTGQPARRGQQVEHHRRVGEAAELAEFGEVVPGVLEAGLDEVVDERDEQLARVGRGEDGAGEELQAEDGPEQPAAEEGAGGGVPAGGGGGGGPPPPPPPGGAGAAPAAPAPAPGPPHPPPHPRPPPAQPALPTH